MTAYRFNIIGEIPIEEIEILKWGRKYVTFPDFSKEKINAYWHSWAKTKQESIKNKIEYHLFYANAQYSKTYSRELHIIELINIIGKFAIILKEGVSREIEEKSTIACVRSEKEGLIFIHLYEDRMPPKYDIFFHCKNLAEQHEGSIWFIADASKYTVTFEPNYEK